MLEKMYPESIFVSAMEENNKKYKNAENFVNKIRKKIMIFF